MKTKFPDILKYKEWINLFSNIDFSHLIKSQKVDNIETPEMRKRREEIIIKMKSMENDFIELENLMIDYKRLFIMNELDFTINTQRDVKSKNNNMYHTAKLMWTERTGNNRQIRISLGKVDENRSKNISNINERVITAKKTFKNLLTEMYKNGE